MGSPGFVNFLNLMAFCAMALRCMYFFYYRDVHCSNCLSGNVVDQAIFMELVQNVVVIEI